MARELSFERLLGTEVLDVDGRAAGRIEEARARRRGDQIVVMEYVLGVAGLVERLALGPVLRALLGTRLYPESARYTIGWEQLDLSDPEQPRLRIPVAELERRVSGRGRPAGRRASP